MEITTAKSAGFCFGVERAVNTVLACLQKGEKVSTLGPIIHNPQMVEELAQKGVTIIESLEEHKAGTTVIVRSHGVSREIITQMQAKSIPYIDATCPFVSKIHQLVSVSYGKETIILIAGDPTHPEVLGIVGHCVCENKVISSAQEVSAYILHNLQEKKHYIMVAQTTFNMVEWEKCIVNAKKLCTSVQIFDTICNATAVRQQEAAKLAKCTGVMIVVGGRHSSNTAKLAQICRQYTSTILIETAEELKDMSFDGITKVGITAGASTPVCIIKEVQETMNEMNEIQEELSFEEMLNQSFKSTYNGEKVTAVVTSIAPNEITVDIGTKHAGYVPLHELTDDPTAKCEDLVAKGDSIELLVVRVNDVEGTVMLSKKRLDAAAGFEKVMAGVDSEEIFEGVVTDVIKGGVLALTNGVKVFIPASHATSSRNEDLNSLLRAKISFKILEANRQRRRAVGSVREVLKEQRKVAQEKFWSEVIIGTVYHGTVKSMTDYGVFVDLGGIDGMVHISELSWGKLRHPSQVLKIGETIEVYIKDIDTEKKKISLGYKKDSENPWTVLSNTYVEGDVCKAKIASLTAFGAFAEILPGIDGLIHISQISLERVNRPADILSIGQEVDVKITEIDYDKNRISLSIKALLEFAQEDSAE